MGLFSRKPKPDRKQPEANVSIEKTKERIISPEFKANNAKQAEIAEKMQHASEARGACNKKGDRDGAKINEEIVETCKKELAVLQEEAKDLRNF